MADYTGQGTSEGRFQTTKRFPRSESAPAKPTKNKDLPLELTRRNSIYDARFDQMEINLLSVQGGREYVKRRLSRFSGESKIDWEGGRRADGIEVTGRKQQTHCFPYAGRIVNKISQHVFSDTPKREGIAPEIEQDASADGRSINDLMRSANDYITACGWCWLGVDAPPVDGQVSQLEKTAQKIRPYVQVYSPIEIVDWKFDGIGGLSWLITESKETESTTADQPETCYTVRRIWTLGAVRTVKLAPDAKGKMTVISDETTAIGYSGVPFILVGTISANGHAFDDIESVNRTIMDLESVNRANFFKRCYPQMVLPVSCIQNASDAYGSTGAAAAELIVGMNYPILISKDDATPSYLMPSATDMGALRTELQHLKSNMFESVGLMLQSESRQVASAESKAWDYLDVAQVMKARAEILETAENKVAEIMNKWDSSVALWAANYNRQFDIGDFGQEMNALIMAVNTSMPDAMHRMILTKIFNRLDRLGSEVSDEQRKEIEQAIAEFTPNAMTLDLGGDVKTDESNTETDEQDTETAKPKLSINGQDNVQQQALNGAQVSSLVEVAQNVASGMLSRNAAIEIIMSSFPIDRESAVRIVSTPVDTSKPEPQKQEFKTATP